MPLGIARTLLLLTLVQAALMDIELPSDISDGDHIGSVSVSLPEDVSVELLGDDSIELPGDQSIELPCDENEDLELPEDVIEDVDEAHDSVTLDEELAALNLCQDPIYHVPTPAEAKMLSGKHDLAEIYSPPRLCPVAREHGHTAVLSLDLLTSWDFRDANIRLLCLDLLNKIMVLFVMLCPPCTVFSILQRLWNFKKMSPSYVKQIYEEGLTHLTHAMNIAKQQVVNGRYFAFEHPASSSAWKEDVVVDVGKLPGVQTVDFDQCLLGLVSFSGKPMRKRTRVMTNVPGIVLKLRGCFCKNNHGCAHQLIQGAEGGIPRSVWAQRYPRGFIDAIGPLYR